MPGADDTKNNPNPNDQLDADKNKKPPVVDPPEADAENDLEDFADPEKAKAEIKKLRAEAAKHRTKAKTFEGEVASMKETLGKLKTAFGIEDESQDPAEQVKQLKQQNENYQVELGIVQLARENGITSEQDKYFRFLLSEKFETLKEGEEISEEDLAEIVQSVQSVSTSGKQAPNSTGVGSKAAAKTPAGGSKDSITVEQFAKMNTGEKSKLYTTDSALYSRLLTDAKAKGIL